MLGRFVTDRMFRATVVRVADARADAADLDLPLLVALAEMRLGGALPRRALLVRLPRRRRRRRDRRRLAAAALAAAVHGSAPLRPGWRPGWTAVVADSPSTTRVFGGDPTTARCDHGRLRERPRSRPGPRANRRGGSGERGDDLALEQLDAGVVVGRLGEVVDRVAEAVPAPAREPLDDLLRRAEPVGCRGSRARCGSARSSPTNGCRRASTAARRSAASASVAPMMMLKFAERVISPKSRPIVVAVRRAGSRSCASNSSSDPAKFV